MSFDQDSFGPICDFWTLNGLFNSRAYQTFPGPFQDLFRPSLGLSGRGTYLGHSVCRVPCIINTFLCSALLLQAAAVGLSNYSLSQRTKDL